MTSRSLLKIALQLSFFLAVVSLHAQVEITTDKQAAAFEQRIKNREPDTSKVSAMIILSEWYRISLTPIATANRVKAIVFANRAQKLSKLLDYPKGNAQSNLQFAKIEENARHFPKAKAFIALAINQSKTIGEYNVLGQSYVSQWQIAVDVKDPLGQGIASLEKAVKAFDLAQNKKSKADSQKELADLYQIGGQVALSLTTIKEALANYNAVKHRQLFSIYDLLGNDYTMLGDYKEAIRYSLYAVRNAETYGVKGPSLCTIYNRLGIAYELFKDDSRALECYNKSLSIAMEFDDHPSIELLVMNKAEVLLNLSRNKEALTFMLGTAKKYPWLSAGENLAIASIMIEVYSDANQFKEAQKYCDLVESKLETANLTAERKTEIYQTLIPYFIRQHQFEKAAAYNNLFFRLSKTTRRYDDNEKNYWKFQIDSAAGNYISAIKSFQRYKKHQDEIFNEEKSRQISQLGILYETEKKDKNIQSLKRKSELQQANLKQAQNTRNLTFCGAGLLTVILLLLFIVYRQNIRSHKLLKIKQDEINLKNNSLEGLLTEKEWLLREIHHRVKNNLHMVVGLLASQTEFIKGKEALDAISESQHRVQAMSLIHQKLYQTDNLSLIVMSDYIFELTEYLKMSFDSKSQIRFRLDVEKAEFPLSHSIPIGIMITEAVTNSIKYAFPHTKKGMIGISLHAVTPDTYTLRMWDDGIGIPADFNAENSNSLGMRLIEGLAREIHSELQIYNDGGTVISLTFALPDNQTSKAS